MSDCIFCKIISGEIPGEKIYKDELVTAFNDINPVAPIHILVIPNKHIPSLNEINQEDQHLLGHLLLTVKKVAADQGISGKGYRLIINTGPAANQVVKHLHLHVIGGQNMRHPMG
jgi:histidine triad (HIT) family protein